MLDDLVKVLNWIMSWHSKPPPDVQAALERLDEGAEAARIEAAKPHFTPLPPNKIELDPDVISEQ
jgi:hypothetical protein